MGLNLRPPAQQTGAYPIELTGLIFALNCRLNMPLIGSSCLRLYGYGVFSGFIIPDEQNSALSGPPESLQTDWR